jgi:hypothetical protein
LWLGDPGRESRQTAKLLAAETKLAKVTTDGGSGRRQRGATTLTTTDRQRGRRADAKSRLLFHAKLAALKLWVLALKQSNGSRKRRHNGAFACLRCTEKESQ